MTRSISSARPITGSSSPFWASSVRSRPKALSAGVLLSFLLPPWLPADASWKPSPSSSRFGRSEVRIEFLEDFIAGALDVDFEILQHAGGHAFAFAEQAEQDVLGADVGMVERLGLLAGEREHLLHARRVGDVADHLLLRAGADLLLHLHADGFEVEAHLLQHVDGDALAELDQPEQQMLGADVVVVEAVRFLAGEGEDLLGAGGEVVHHRNELGLRLAGGHSAGGGPWVDRSPPCMAIQGVDWKYLIGISGSGLEGWICRNCFQQKTFRGASWKQIQDISRTG